jgi:NAD(P)-dependent dehydrogenase (short-subunit alcohol dehydrogenase family)
MDVDDDDSVSEAVSALQSDSGPIDVLVNNAGIAGGHSVEETPLAEFQRLMNTNTWGTLRCIQAVLPSMRERSSGHILNVTSLAGRVALAGHGAYAASKFAADALTEVLAAETKPFGIKVTAIEPGVILAPIFAKGMDNPENPDTPYISDRRAEAALPRRTGAQGLAANRLKLTVTKNGLTDSPTQTMTATANG